MKDIVDLNVTLYVPTSTLTEDKETLRFVKIKISDKKKYTALHLWSFSFKSRAPSNVQEISNSDSQLDRDLQRAMLYYLKAQGLF